MINPDTLIHSDEKLKLRESVFESFDGGLWATALIIYFRRGHFEIWARTVGKLSEP